MLLQEKLHTDGSKVGTALSDGVREAIQRSEEIVPPSWPLQNLIAVNPFWHLRDRKYEDVLTSISPAIHHRLLMPLEYYLERHLAGEIIDSAIDESIRRERTQWPDAPETVAELLTVSKNEPPLECVQFTVAERLSGRTDWHRGVIYEVGKFAAAYFDEHQAIAFFPWQDSTFWEGWLAAQRFDASMEKMGACGFRPALHVLRGSSPEEAIEFMLGALGFKDPQEQILYTQRLTATVLGWASKFKYLEWQREQGKPVERSARLVDLVAVRMAYDFGLSQVTRHSGGETPKIDHSSRDEYFRLGLIWQRAHELSDQFKLSRQLKGRATEGESTLRPRLQMVFCIDVRSEMIRRHIEAQDIPVQTLGFAGFFGLPISYSQDNMQLDEACLPPLLSPTLHVHGSRESAASVGSSDLSLDLVFSYFRNLRKAPLSSFLYVELFGVLSIEKILKRTWASILGLFRRRSLPSRFEARSRLMLRLDSSYEEQADLAENILRNMGIRRFADLVFIVGHGSATTNNAFASSLDCGACGGHPGDVNARLFCEILNAESVRAELSRRGIEIPADTRFVPALHETVTDRVHILDWSAIGEKHAELARDSERIFDVAAREAQKERTHAFSDRVDPNPFRRSHSWSEVRPEWGLTGNASFIVAPRERTKGLNLGGRTFLHDYDWKTDPGFKTLELIMTAPVVVGNWINMQYYASTVAPQIYGAGSKTLHNLTSEMGVVEGNGGDLRIGIPIQSVHDGIRFVHRPLRLSVFIEAPRAEIERVISKHQTVRQLVENEWLYLLVIEPSGTFRRLPGGGYDAVDACEPRAETRRRTPK